MENVIVALEVPLSVYLNHVMVNSLHISIFKHSKGKTLTVQTVPVRQCSVIITIVQVFSNFISIYEHY